MYVVKWTGWHFITFSSATRCNIAVPKRMVRDIVLQRLRMDMKLRCQCRRCPWCTEMMHPCSLLHIRGCHTSCCWCNQSSSVHWEIPVCQSYGNADLPLIQSMQRCQHINVQDTRYQRLRCKRSNQQYAYMKCKKPDELATVVIIAYEYRQITQLEFGWKQAQQPQRERERDACSSRIANWSCNSLTYPLHTLVFQGDQPLCH